MKQEFKAGDKVYYPSGQVQIYTLRASDCGIYPLVIKDDSFIRSFTLYGQHYNDDPLPSILHATPENHELLTKLYGVEFEAPPKPKTPKEVIQAMLDDGWYSVPCYVSNNDKMTAIKGGVKALINMFSVDSWEFFIPFDIKTGKIIIDYIDGEIVTE